MKVVALIAARISSKRLPKKVLAIIEDKPIIEHLIDRITKAKNIDSFVLCTTKHPEDKILIEIAKKKGIKWFAGSKNDVLKRFIKAGENEKADIIVRVNGDSILRDPEYADKAIRHHMETGADYTYIDGLPKGTQVEVISFSALKKAHELAENPNMSEYMSLYFKTPEFFKIEKIEAEKNVRRPYRLCIDTPEDLELMKKIFKKLYKPDKMISLQEIVKFLDKNKRLLKINEEIEEKKIEKKIIIKKGKPKIKIEVLK